MIAGLIADVEAPPVDNNTNLECGTERMESNFYEGIER